MTATFALICVLLAATMSGAGYNPATAAPRGAPNGDQRSEGRTLADAGEVSAFLGAPQVAGAPSASSEGRLDGGAPLLAAVTASESIAMPGGSFASPAAVTYQGIVNYATPAHGRWYLAIPAGPGVRVRICGPAGCLERTSTDAGPDLAQQRAGRIADLNWLDWQRISGVGLKYGGFQGTVLVLSRVKLPETDTDRPTPP